MLLPAIAVPGPGNALPVLVGGFDGLDRLGLLERFDRAELDALEPERLILLLVGGLALGLLALTVPRLWLLLRIGVTVVHELGHAVVGILTGRRLLGIRVSWDMSGETVTTGKPRGIGLILTTLAGYPIPPVVGAVFLWAAAAGWAQLALFAGAVLLVLLLVMVRSLLTAAAFLAVIAFQGIVWWLDEPLVSTAVAIGIGVLLLAGGLRAIGGLMSSHARGRAERSDAAALARLTHVPAALWLGLFTLVGAASALLAAWSWARFLGL